MEIAQNEGMTLRAIKVSTIATGALLFSLALPYSSFADMQPAPTPTTIDEYRTAMDQFRSARDSFNQSARLRDQQIRSINTTFKAAVDKATRDAKLALSSAKTPEEKTTVVNARQSAIASAITLRDSAIAALPPLGEPPVEPIRPDVQQMQKMNPMKPAPQKGRGKN